MDKRYQVFVSSTYRDLLEHRQLVMKALMQLNAIPAGMELFPAADSDAWTLIQRAIEESDYYIVIVGGRYGSVDKDGVSFTEKEYDYAAAKGKPIMAFLHEKPEALPRENTETDPGSWEKLKAFRTKAQERHCKFWISREDLITKVLTSYHLLVYTHPAEGWVRGKEARTIEDVDRLVRLQQRVSELEGENRRLQMASEDDTSVFQQGDDDVMIEFTYECNGKQQPSCVGATWDEVFRAVGEQLLQEGALYVLCKAIGRFAAAKRGVYDSTNRNSASVSPSELDKIRNQFLALKLIAVERRDRGSTWWTLTDRGSDYLGRLLALRRPSSSPGAAASA